MSGCRGRTPSECQGLEATGDLTCSRISKKLVCLGQSKPEGMKED